MTFGEGEMVNVHFNPILQEKSFGEILCHGFFDF